MVKKDRPNNELKQENNPTSPQPPHRTFVPMEKSLFAYIVGGAAEKKIDFEVTRSSIFNQSLFLLQPKKGYRFSLDSILLADFADVRPGQAVADLGTGVGVIGIILAWRMRYGRIVLVEIQSRLAMLARRNVENNKLGPDMDVLELDWNDLTPDTIQQPMVGGPVDYIVCNPPYRSLGTGRLNPDNEEAIARHEILGSLIGVIKAAKRFLIPGGKLAVIYPASRMARLIAELKNRGFEPKRMRVVHSRINEPARFIMVEAKSGGGEELEVLPPLIVYRNKKDYSKETRAILSGRPAGGP